MIEVKVPKDLSEYKEKAALGMTLRQLVCFGAVCITSVASYWIFGNVWPVGRGIKGYLSMALSAPWLAAGFIEVNGLPFERHAALVIRRLLTKGARPYIAVLESSEEEEEDARIRIARKQKRRNKSEPERPVEAKAAKAAAKKAKR